MSRLRDHVAPRIHVAHPDNLGVRIDLEMLDQENLAVFPIGLLECAIV
jgi:hypothetical protein